jgi:DNA/RNA endonuclease G (NUC1)
MGWRAGLVAALVAVLLVTPIEAQAQDCSLTSTQQMASRAEHLFGGQPAPGPVLVRRGYITQYDATHRVPRWTTWHATPAYLGTPSRQGQWATFRTDPTIPNPVRTGDYNGVGAINMARGHIVPYFMAGGDRDGDGLKAASNQNAVLDLYDACTVYEVNYMSNIAPQFQTTFNGSGGLWYELEERIRLNIVGGDFGGPVHIIAGTVFGEAPVERVGAGNIPVPHMFFQILITPYGVVPFLFVHTAQIGRRGVR